MAPKLAAGSPGQLETFVEECETKRPPNPDTVDARNPAWLHIYYTTTTPRVLVYFST